MGEGRGKREEGRVAAALARLAGRAAADRGAERPGEGVEPTAGTQAAAAHSSLFPLPSSLPSARDRVAWDRIRYASVWEDADVLCEALAPVAAGGRLLSVASSGDNALALLTLDPAEVVAVDLNPAQLACLEIRVAAFRHLDDEALLPFLGVGEAADRLATYRALRGELSAGARAFWEAHPRVVAAGVVHGGKFERYLRAFRRWALPLVHSRRTMARLVEPKDAGAQRAFYRERWDTRRWRLLFRLFFSRAVMGRMGRDPALFDHVEGSVGERILERTRYALSELPASTNPYLVYIMTGGFSPGALPRYLRPESRAEIRTRLGRLSWVRGGAESVPGPFDGFNLSDIFEYMAPAEHERVYGEILARARRGARLVYWNMLAERARPERFRARAEPLAAHARALHARDRAWFYQRLHVDEVRG
jgi:S-adenosylmethionine-diacylglycerol 3-amino-3-carboxypropyl transferase